MLAALNFDLYNKQRGTGWTHQDLRQYGTQRTVDQARANKNIFSNPPKTLLTNICLGVIISTSNKGKGKSQTPRRKDMKYYVTFSCGHEGEVNLYGKAAERDRRIAWYEKEGICPDCYRDRL